jgi:hypothetical protein
MIQTPSNSRFKFTPSVIFDGQETFGRWVPPDALDRPEEATLYKVTSQVAGRPDLISFQFFGTPDLYWAIIAMNKPRTLLWPNAGDVIMIPSEAILSEL